MLIQRILTAAAMVLMLGESASALSCMRPDLERAMESAKASDDLYHIFVGRFEAAPLPKRPPSQNPEDQFRPRPAQYVMANFSGKALSQYPQYDSAIRNAPVEIKITCAGPWCGGVPQSGEKIIAFVKARPNMPPLLEIGACPDKTFTLQPKTQQIKRLRACFDRACQAPSPRRDLY